MIQTIRGKNYNMRKIMELYDSGLTPAEIAHRLRINSVQSLRHAIERQNREREEKERILKAIDKENEAKQKMEQGRLEYEARQKDKAKREKLRKDILAPNTGMFTYAIDRQTFEALEYVMKRQWGNSFFIDSEEQEIYVPENLDILEVKLELLMSGFVMELKKKSQTSVKPLKVGIMHNALMSKIPFEKQKVDIFTPAKNAEAYGNIKKAFKVLITAGIMKFSGLSDISFSEQINLDSVRNQIRSLGYYGEIGYKPLEILDALNKKVLGKIGDCLYIVNSFEDAEITEEILDIWNNFEAKAILNSLVREYVLDKEITLGEAVRPFLNDVLDLMLKHLEYRYVIVFPLFQGYDDIPEFHEMEYMQSLRSMIYDTILNYYIQLHENREQLKAEEINM